MVVARAWLPLGGGQDDDQLENSYDVVVVGGGAAGLNGALMLARSRRSVAVIDSGAPRNAPNALGVHGLLARDGMSPAELLARGRAEVRGYGGHVVDGEVADAAREGDGFTVTLVDGKSVRARRLLVASGVTTCCRRSQDCGNGGDATYSTVRTAMAGRFGTRPSAYWPPGRCRYTRRCSSGS